MIRKILSLSASVLLYAIVGAAAAFTVYAIVHTFS